MKIGSNQKALLLSVIASVALAGLVNAEDIYVAQTAQGADTGVNAANAHSLAWLNTSANWGVGVDKVSAGDTVHLTGVFTGALTLQGSGTAGNPITILGESGQKFSAGTWTSDIITANSQSYLTIDSVNMEATANGQGLAASNTFNGISFSGACSFVTVRNTTVSNFYYRVAGLDAGGSCQGIAFNVTGSREIYIHNNVQDMVGNAINFLYGGNCTNVQIYSNSCTRISWGIGLSTSSPGWCSGFEIWANRADHFENWDGNNAAFHQDGIIYNIQNVTSATNYGCKIYRNHIGPNFSRTDGSSHIFSYVPGMEDHSPGLMIYNNLLENNAASHVFDGLISVGFNGTVVANNTLISSSSQGDFGVRIYGATNVSILNNVIRTSGGVYVGSGFNQKATNFISALDFNNYGASTVFMSGGYSWYNWTNYLAFGLDTRSTTNTPVIDTDYSPKAGDSALTGKGTNLSALFTADFKGNARPATGPWTTGAFQPTTNTNRLPPPRLRDPAP